MAPPSQAGKFKPRKKPKKVGAPVAAAAAAAEAASASAAPQASTSESGRGSGGAGRRGGGRDGGGRGRGGRGRDGRGGRGGRTPRAPISMGNVFFTGAPAPAKKGATSASASSSGGAAGGRGGGGAGGRMGFGGRGGRGRGMDSGRSEEIVEIMEEGVGSGLQPDSVTSGRAGRGGISGDQIKTEAAVGRALEQDALEQLGSGRNAKKSPYFESIIYDSDSSREERRQKTTGSKQPPKMQPLVLPFPPNKAQRGIGGTDIPDSLQDDDDKDDEMGATHLKNLSLNEDKPGASPFVDPMNRIAMARERDSWFLVQLPTRLPALQDATAAGAAEAGADDDNEGAKSADTPAGASATETTVSNTTAAATADIASVAVNPMDTDGFDNSMMNAPAGRLGKLQVYRSGKTVLILEDENGEPTVQMNVSSGLPCAFVQQAVMIDRTRSEFVPLGDVKKTVIVTPDLHRAFEAPQSSS